MVAFRIFYQLLVKNAHRDPLPRYPPFGHLQPPNQPHPTDLNPTSVSVPDPDRAGVARCESSSEWPGALAPDPPSASPWLFRPPQRPMTSSNDAIGRANRQCHGVISWGRGAAFAPPRVAGCGAETWWLGFPRTQKELFALLLALFLSSY